MADDSLAPWLSFCLLDAIAFEQGVDGWVLATESAVELKVRDVKKLHGKKTVKILCNVSTPEYAMELIKLGADEVLTPFADDMAKSLIKRFGIKSLKLR